MKYKSCRYNHYFFIFLLTLMICACNTGNSSNSVDDSLSSSSENSSNRLKILALHGGGESVQSFQSQAGMRALVAALPNYEFVFASAPEAGNLWISDPSGGKSQPTTDRDWANRSILYLDQFVSDNGPFEVILGYSQGCAIAVLYITANESQFRKIVLFNGYRPTTHLGLNAIISESSPFNLPNLIFGGRQDPFFYGVAELEALFTTPNVVISNEADHHLPFSTDATFQQVVDFISGN